MYTIHREIQSEEETTFRSSHFHRCAGARYSELSFNNLSLRFWRNLDIIPSLIRRNQSQSYTKRQIQHSTHPSGSKILATSPNSPPGLCMNVIPSFSNHSQTLYTSSTVMAMCPNPSPVSGEFPET